MYLETVHREEALEVSGAHIHLLKLGLPGWWHTDNIVASVSGDRGTSLDSLPSPDTGNPEGFELSAFDTQKQESRAKLPLKHYCWTVHCGCNWVSWWGASFEQSLLVLHAYWGLPRALCIPARWHCPRSLAFLFSDSCLSFFIHSSPPFVVIGYNYDFMYMFIICLLHWSIRSLGPRALAWSSLLPQHWHTPGIILIILFVIIIVMVNIECQVDGI